MAEKFRTLALLSADAIIRGRNSTHADMNPWWTRDQGIGWPKYRGERANRERNLEEKNQSIKMWKEIVRLAEAITWADEKTQQHAIGSASYGLHLYQIYRAVIFIEDAATKKNTKALAKWIQHYDESYLSYNQLAERFPTLSTLYTQDYNRHIRGNAHLKIKELRNR